MSAAKVVLAALYVVQSGALVLQGSDREQRLALDDSVPHFEVFCEQFGRSYKRGSEEYAMRKSIYEAKVYAAIQQNSQPSARWTARVNFLWDRTEAEFKELRGWHASARPAYNMQGSGHSTLLQEDNATDLPAEKSWVSLKTFNHTPNQGACGSCWAIAASRVLQAHTEFYTKVERSFSAQQLVSCVPNPEKCGGEGGCQGATVELAYAWVMDFGLADDTQVPYWANNSACTVPNSPPLALAASSVSKSKKSRVAPHGVRGAEAFGMTGWARLPENENHPLMRALVEHGPVAVSAAGSWWALYGEGIFDGCPADVVIDHAVVLVAYGQVVDKGVVTAKYWTLQNSWGSNWGEDGYIRIVRTDTEQEYCGINTDPQIGTGCEGGPPNVTVCGMCGIFYDSVVPFFK